MATSDATDEAGARTDVNDPVKTDSGKTDAPATTESAAPGPRGTLGVIFAKPARTILLVALLLALPLMVPQLGAKLNLKGENYRDILPSPHELISFKGSETAPNAGDLPGDQTAGQDSPIATQDPKEADPGRGDRDIEDPARALDSFYAALARTDAKEPGAITRITHYGDSPITNDGLTAPVRRLLQERFGDAGHGFILVAKPWGWYGHQAITFTSSSGWNNDSLMNPSVNDGELGLGGVTSRASGPGQYARFAPATDGDTGKNFSNMDVYFLRQPSGGEFSASVNGANAQTVSTQGPAAESGFFQIKAPSNSANTFEIKTVSGNVRMFGAVLENDGPGLVYDSLGVNGAYAGLLVTVMNEQHWIVQLQHRRPDLVILNYGTNESQYASDNQMARYDRDLREVIRRVREALPNVSIMVVSPMDRGTLKGGRVVTLPAIPKIVDLQRRVALESNCAFFSLFNAMGGEGTMAKWHEGKNHLVGGDFTHPNGEGAEIIGSLIYEAITSGYLKYKARIEIGKRPVVVQR
jgi:lysophospholipase L1-like esterase